MRMAPFPPPPLKPLPLKPLPVPNTQVMSWASSLSPALASYSSIFSENNVDGKVLLTLQVWTLCLGASHVLQGCLPARWCCCVPVVDLSWHGMACHVLWTRRTWTLRRTAWRTVCTVADFSRRLTS
jgi:hypothetical protein